MGKTLRSPVVMERRLQAQGLQQSQHADSVTATLRLQSVSLVILGHELSCSETRGIFLDQGLNPCPLHWQADSYLQYHQGSPRAFRVFVGLSQRAVESVRLYPVSQGSARSLIIPRYLLFFSFLSYLFTENPVSSRSPKRKLLTRINPLRITGLKSEKSKNPSFNPTLYT